MKQLVASDGVIHTLVRQPWFKNRAGAVMRAYARGVVDSCSSCGEGTKQVRSQTLDECRRLLAESDNLVQLIKDRLSVDRLIIYTSDSAGNPRRLTL